MNGAFLKVLSRARNSLYYFEINSKKKGWGNFGNKVFFLSLIRLGTEIRALQA